MKCHRCAKVATLHITEIVKGAANELHLCEDCARTYLSTGEPGSGGGSIAKEGEPAELDELDKLVCPTCQLTFRDFRNQGRLGCAHCYNAFQSELLPLLENIQEEVQHTGKCPKRAPDDSQKQFELIKLRNDLRQAVADESYELAAKLRDQIHALEQNFARGAAAT